LTTLSSIYPVSDASGEVIRFAVYAADITQQRRVEAIEALFSAINQKVLQGLLLSELLQFICSEVARLFDLDLIWLGRKEADGAVSIMTQAGPATGYVEGVKRLGVRWDDTPQGRGATGTAIRSGQIQVINASNPGCKVWKELAQEFNLQSMLAIPLLIRGEVYGAFTLYSRQLDAFSANTTDLLVGIASRISVALEAAMDQQQIRLLSSALAAAGSGVMITNSRGIILWVNPAFIRLSGYSREELVGQTPRVLKSGHQTQEFYRHMWEMISRGETWSNEMVERSKSGEIYTVSQTITPMLDENGGITHFIAIHEDITVQKLAQERIQYLAHYDALTDLPNRVLFYDRLRQALSMARRAQSGLALLFLDLDGFKAVNDTMGHQAGDLLLKEVAERLQQCVRESDTVARLGGDEFTVILNEAHDHHDVAMIAEKIIDAIAAPFDLEERGAYQCQYRYRVIRKGSSRMNW
jgi:diguanylate cyclase (GGDEF)-like protein/PAS domain S-box-containing protein